MESISKRELLQELAKRRIGSAELQAQPFDKEGKLKPEVKEAAKRATKLWLPEGRKPPRQAAPATSPPRNNATLRMQSSRLAESAVAMPESYRPVKVGSASDFPGVGDYNDRFRGDVYAARGPDGKTVGSSLKLDREQAIRLCQLLESAREAGREEGIEC